ncbi:MAG: MBL fold metallo-hydrolase [Gemmatimonadales bacterium]
MTPTRRLPVLLPFGALLASSCAAPPPPPVAAAAVPWCEAIPRSANAAFDQVPDTGDWFDVRRVADGVFALIEPNQFQETISYLIVGRDRALLFDTGLGLVPIRPVVERLTDRPVSVLNSHTHYDHVGGNAEFDDVLALDTPYTRANQRGFAHAELAGEVAPAAFCHGAPAEVDTAGYHTRAWTAARRIADGEGIDLGGRTLTVIRVPGHTPDAVALLDRDHRLLWTGDTYYDAAIWLYVPETDLNAYEQSLDRLVGLANGVDRLLPAHNTVSAVPGRLAEALAAFRRVRAGEVAGTEETGRRKVFSFPNFAFLISTPLLEGKQGDAGAGGSGLTTWP